MYEEGQPKFSLDPQEPQVKPSLFANSTGTIVAVILVVTALFIGFRAFTSSQSTKQYEGLIQKVQFETQALKSRTE